MIPEEIFEGNKLIAEFMAIRYYTDDPLMKIFLESDYDAVLFYCEWHPEWSKGTNVMAWKWEPHKSWCQLMPVVERIEQMNYGFKICRKVVEVYIDSTKETIIHVKEKNQIKFSLYKAIVEFIKTYKK